MVVVGVCVIFIQNSCRLVHAASLTTDWTFAWCFDCVCLLLVRWSNTPTCASCDVCRSVCISACGIFNDATVVAVRSHSTARLEYICMCVRLVSCVVLFVSASASL